MIIIAKTVLYATGFFEVGDSIYDEKGIRHTVTDILVCHYLSKGIYKLLYEVDHSGDYIDLKFQGFEEDMLHAKETPKKPQITLRRLDTVSTTEKK